MELNLLDLFRDETKMVSFPEGAVIFEEHESGDVMYVIKSGQVDIKTRGMTIEIAGPGALFGEMALVDVAARSASAVARTDCELIPVDEELFVSLIQQTPYIALHVMGVLVRRLRNMNQLL